ncbi:uncharacterized protein LOC115882762 isoform X3 [Sitophilus oryzae]|uniref:Uncharacterized protein LOC115882762 isoform X3 n=1 Tax=Sitophilus oryzae TaxID=7048 RepID=A0A6J2XZH8_SITOR|nr:uncharacterized protein LOC115882762 isoform X3 [Sitophilus oryzae]
MDTLRNFLILFFMVSVTLSSCSGTADVNSTSDTIFKKNLQSSKGREMRSYIGMIGCAVKYDFSCFLNVAEDYLEMQKTELLAEADAEALQSSGRSDPESKPSYLASIIGKLMKEVSAMFQDGLGGFMKTARESDDEEDDEDDDSDSNVTAVEARKSSEGVARSKKKKEEKKKMMKSIHLLLLIMAVKAKVFLLLKLASVAMLGKLLLISTAHLVVSILKYISSLKKHSHDEKPVVYYHDTHHDHHYDDHVGVDDHSGWFS